MPLQRITGNRFRSAPLGALGHEIQVDDRVRLIDAETGSELRDMEGERQDLDTVGVTPDGRFVGEKFDIGYVSTARDLLGDAIPVAGTASLAIWANPDFGASVARPASPDVALVASRAASARELRHLRLEPVAMPFSRRSLIEEPTGEFREKHLGFQIGKLR